MSLYASSSSSSSTTMLSQGYDVFLSFRGEDTRTGFTSHLYDALTRNDITAYKDDKSLEIGNFIAPELLEAIEASKFAIVVLSKDFATSKWCLEEIAKIVDCMKRGKLTVIPVFYHVTPSEVRHQSNSFEQGFTNHEVDPKIAPEKVETWRAAFAKVGDISGLHVTEHRNETEVIRDIVSKILKDTQDTLPIDLPDDPVGIQSHVEEVKTILTMDSNEVLFIGICGMSGIGETTLAEAVYKAIKYKFQKSSFLENIKEISKQNDSTDLRNLQQKLLDEILKERSIPVQSVKHGQTLLGTKLRGFKIIIVLDSNEVLFIGICGMSGIGKTTLAEAVYKAIKYKFQKSSFLENIKEISKQNDSTDLRNLQQKLLDEILKERSIPVQSVKHGQTLLGTKLRGFKIIIVLDDVNHQDQLTYLAGTREWFGPGSRIIITTTNMDLLNLHGINEIHRCEEMKGDEALRLFCQSAFKQEHPAHGYEKLTDDIVKLAGGLPLALNVYGSLLCRKEKSYWKSMLSKLGKYPEKEVLGRLEVVYTRLDRCQRKAFIYIACFLKGRNKDLVEHILNNIGLECGITDLRNKCLITINLEDCVWMHDLLQLMCWEILNKESFKYVGKHIAINSPQDIVNILSSDSKETETIEIINQEPYNVEVDLCFIDPTCFSKMTNLKFLRISNVHFNKGRLNYLSNGLRILEWYGCPLKTFPSTFEPKHVFELEMCNTQLKSLWEKDQVLPNLRSFNLSYSKNLTKIPDLTSALNLVKINLEGCTDLKELHESLLLQKRVRYMNLKGCTRLRSLGRSNMEMEALEALILSGCSNLKNIPDFGQNMKRLEHLYVDGTSIKKLPDSLGEMCDLRKLDVSGTSIEELPSFIHRLRKLRLLCGNRCHLSFKTRGFLYPNLDTLSSGLRDLDLSYCNMAVLPDGICLLPRLINLDLSGNDFVKLPTSISLLSNLKMLCLNDCKKLNSLPKLSIVNEEYTLYGLQIRFKYYISREGADVSKYHATSNGSSPTVLCLNCPKLLEDHRYPAEKILYSYLNLRADDWITAEAVFEIVGAGKEIPDGFKLLGSDDLIIYNSWTGVAICAVVSVHHAHAYLEESKYVVTAHIYVGEKHWSVPFPIHFLVPGLDNQLVFYWTIAENERLRTIPSCRFSFSVEPEDGNVKVTSFGVRIIRNKDEKIMTRKLFKFKSLVVDEMFRDSLSLPSDMLHLLPIAADTDLQNLYSSFKDDLTNSIKEIILDHRNVQNSLYVIHKIIKCIYEVNQELLSGCGEEWKHAQLFPLVYDYYQIIHETSQFCNDFVGYLKDVYNSWISVKLALEKLVVKSRANDYPYAAIRQQLNVVEASSFFRLSDRFVIPFAHFCKKIAAFSTHLVGVMHGLIKFKSLKVLMKVSRLTIAGIFSMVAIHMCDSELLQEMKDTTSNDIWLNFIFGKSLIFGKRSRKREDYLKIMPSMALWTWDFNDNAILLQELRNKITCPSATKGIEEEMVIVIDKLEKHIDRMSKTIGDMSSQAYKYSRDIKEAGETFNQFIIDGKLPVTKLGFCFERDEDILQLKGCKDPMREAVNNLFSATAFLPPALHSYIRVYRGQKKIRKIIKSNIKSILHAEQDPFLHTLKIIRCLYLQFSRARYFPTGIEGLNEWLDEWFFLTLYKITNTLVEFLKSFKNLLTGVSESWSSVMLALEHILLKSRVGENTYEETLQQLYIVGVDERIEYSDEIFSSLEYICDKSAVLLRMMNSVICNKKLEAPNFSRPFSLRIYRNKKIKWMKSMKKYGKILSLTNNCILRFVATCMGDFELLQEIENMTSNSTLLHLIQCFSRKSGNWFDERGCIKKASNGGELQIWDLYGNTTLLQELKNKMAAFSCFTIEAEEEMVLVIHKLKKKLNDLSDGVDKTVGYNYYN